MDTSIMQPIHQPIAHLALEIDIHNRQIGTALHYEGLRLSRGGYRSGDNHSPLLER